MRENFPYGKSKLFVKQITIIDFMEFLKYNKIGNTNFVILYFFEGIYMKIIVCMKQVPGTNKADIDPVTGVIKRDGADCKTNPYDLYALEAALRLREENGGTVTVVTMGPPQAAQVIREAYSMGADHGVLVSDRCFAGSDVLATSMSLSQAIKTLGGFDLILCGKQTTDGDTAQVGPEIGELLCIPSAAGINKILGPDKQSISVQADMISGIGKIRIKLPCLLCVEKDICEPRLPSYRKKISTSDKEITMLSLDDFTQKDKSKYGLEGSPTQVRRIFPPESGDKRELWQGTAEELARKFYDTLQKLKFLEESI